MNPIIEEAYRILEQTTVLSFRLATQMYEHCCAVLGLIPSPLLFTEAQEPEKPP